MPSHRVVVAAAAATFVLVIVAGAFIALTRDGAIPAHGDLIAFSCKEPNNIWYAICTATSDGAERRRITTRMQTTNPAWSPDGRRIAFTRNEDVGEYTTLSADDVFVMDADGSDVEQLTADQVGVHSGQPAWSPDGMRIAFVRGASVPTALVVRPGSVFVMNADGSDVQRLTRGWLDARPAWSPDGREIAFSRSKRFASSSRAIWVMDADGGRLRKLTHAAKSLDGAPAWSPDGARIAFVRLTRESPVNGKAALYIMNRDGSDLRELLRYELFDFFYYGLTWSPNGKSIAFEASPNRSCVAISVIYVQTRTIRPLTSCQFPRQSTRAPVWQPDAEKRKRS
jgi:Tol biopolymer transport system component